MLLSVLESTKCLLELQTGKTLIRLLLQSDLGLHCLSRLNWEATGVRNSRTLTIPHREHSGRVLDWKGMVWGSSLTSITAWCP